MRQRPPKQYVNGMMEETSHFKKAKEILVRKGLYQKMGNFGPYFPNKESRIHSKLETWVEDDMEFIIIESQVMSFSFSSMETSNPYKQREAWYQPVHTPTITRTNNFIISKG